MGGSYTTFAGFDVAVPVAAPLAAAGTSSGSLGLGNYTYKVTFVSNYGETSPSPASSVVTTTSGSVNLSGIPVSVETNIIARRLYRTTSGGGTWNFLATISDNTTTVYVDTIADGSLGALAPTANTAMSREIARGLVAFSSPVVYATVSGIVAHAGGGQALATPLVGEYNLLATVASAADSVALPTLNANRIGMKLSVKNNTATAANVFPTSGQNINALGADTAISVGAGLTLNFVAVSATNWQTF